MKKLILLLILLAACTQQPEHGHEAEALKLDATSDAMDLHGVMVTFNRPLLETGKPANIAFIFTKNDQLVELEKLHGMDMHIIIVKEDLSIFEHLHGKKKETGYGATHTFSEAGDYRMWIEFQLDGQQHTVMYKLHVS